MVLPAVVDTELARGTATAGVPDEPGGGDGCGDALAAPPDVGADGSVLRRGAGEIGKRPAAMGIRNALNYKMVPDNVRDADLYVRAAYEARHVV